MAIEVRKSEDINSLDRVKNKGKVIELSLEDTNDFEQDVILLYMYILPKFPYHGVKVGMTKCKMGETFWHAIKSRIRKQEYELALTPDQYPKYGMEREVIYWGICLDAKNESFKDYRVHKEIKSKCAGLMEKDQEWFLGVPTDELVEAFNSCRQNDIEKTIYVPRKEQQDCIDTMKEYFDANPIGGRFLMNCKMRFGKSFTTYKYCEEAGLKKILILTFIPAVESSWKEDLNHVKTEYAYYTDANLRRDGFEPSEIDKPFVIFLSLQNYLGRDKDNKDVKDKIKKLQKVDFDVVILDEYHFGAWNERTQDTFEDLDKDYQKNLSKVKNVIETFAIKTKRTICLSGTPFKAIARGEFLKDNTYTYSYFDEQKNKYPNENDSSVVNPKYAHFPDMRIFGYNMSRLFGEDFAGNLRSDDKLLSKKYFSLNKFFRTRKDDSPLEPIKFIYEEEIKFWLEIIKGKSPFGSNFPYSNPLMLQNSQHTLWLMPSVNSCIAMAELLKNDEYFSRYQIINLSGEGVGAGVNAFDHLMEQIQASRNLGKLGSIAITVNKLTTGVTVKDWYAVFVLKDLASPESYFQSIFRIQTPFVKDGEIKKKYGYVYDFNIDRASALLLKYADEFSKNERISKIDIAKLIVKYLPIYTNGDMNSAIDYQVFYELAMYGDTSGIPLSKKIRDTSKTTRIRDDAVIAEMLNDEEVSDIIKHVFAHAKFKHTKGGEVPPKPEDDSYKNEITTKGRKEGHRLGLEDYELYLDLDDTKVQEEFEQKLFEYIKMYCPEEYDDIKKTYYSNGMKKGYETGINAPIKKMYCGKEDGKAFVEKVKEKFGQNIKYTNDTKVMIKNFVRTYLNDINNIPKEYRGMLYKRWYIDSFERAVIAELTPVVKDKESTSVEDADNVIQHILTRLFEFLYISVYRETTFNEIFNNADPDTFLEAVGITKKDFEILNKYNIFEEITLNNYIHEFFVNESLGAKLDMTDESVRRQYRNSFDWFGFGVLDDTVESTVVSNNEILVVEQIDVVKEESNEEVIEEDTIVTEDIKIDNPYLRIYNFLKDNKKGMKASQIADRLGMNKREVNKILYANKNVFAVDIFFNWKIR